MRRDSYVPSLKDFLLGLVFFPVAVLFGTTLLWLGYIDHPSWAWQKGYVAEVKERTLPAMPLVTFVDYNSGGVSKLCIDKEMLSKAIIAKDGHNLLEIEYGRGWFLPIWKCSLFDEKIKSVEYLENK